MTIIPFSIVPLLRPVSYEPARRAAPLLPRSEKPSLLGRLIAALREFRRRYRSRRSLVRLNPYLLKDIGVSYTEAEFEANKPFWLE